MELISKLLEGKEEDFPNPILFRDTCGLNKEYFFNDRTRLFTYTKNRTKLMQIYQTILYLR